MTELNEMLDIVDSEGGIIGQAQRGEVYRKGLLHKAVNILIIDSRKRVFLQQRANDKKAYPLYWDISASEHCKAGEAYNDAALIRGVREELGISTPLELVRPVHAQSSSYQNGEEIIYENELVELYLGVLEGEVTIDQKEVAQGRFYSVDEISQKIKGGERFTPWFLDEWNFLQITSEV